MKPISIVFSINISFFIIFGLMFTLVMNRPELIPLFTSFQAAINLLGVGVFFLDRKKDLGWAFVFGFALALVATLIGYYFLVAYVDTIGVEEGFTL